MPLASGRGAVRIKAALVAENETHFHLEVVGLLEDEGYVVVEAVNAAQAFERLDGSVSLLVTDVRMPGAMDGLALAREVARTRPDVAVVVVSAQMPPVPGDLPEGVPFIGRPFLERRIRTAIREVVAAKARAGHA